MTALDLEHGAALSAAMTEGPIVVHEPPYGGTALETAGASYVGCTRSPADAAGIAWLATHRDELIRLAAVGQAMAPAVRLAVLQLKQLASGMDRPYTGLALPVSSSSLAETGRRLLEVAERLERAATSEAP